MESLLFSFPLAFQGAETGVAYWAHVGGFLTGWLFGMTALWLGRIEMGSYDNPTLLDIFKNRQEE